MSYLHKISGKGEGKGEEATTKYCVPTHGQMSFEEREHETPPLVRSVFLCGTRIRVGEALFSVRLCSIRRLPGLARVATCVGSGSGRRF